MLRWSIALSTVRAQRIYILFLYIGMLRGQIRTRLEWCPNEIRRRLEWVTDEKRVHILGADLPFWVPILGPFRLLGSPPFEGSPTPVLQRMSSQVWQLLFLSVMINDLHCHYTCMLWNDASRVHHYGHCWQILIITYAYALFFIHRRYGSLFWLLRVLIGSLFHKKMGPYLKALGSLLVLEAVRLKRWYDVM